jgi:AraC family transcriptional regulator of adaptative response / DNA-3-methyladenine glycosylase II
MREVFRASPRELRDRRHRADRLAADGGLAMRLPFQPPYDWDGMLRFFADRAVPGVESVEDGAYRRTISLDGDPGVLEIQAGDGDYLLLRAHLPYWEGLIHVVERVARMVGADADPGPAVENLGADPVIGALVSARPGIRVPGAWGPLEVAIHAIVAEHASLRQARGHMGALVETFGQSVPGLSHGRQPTSRPPAFPLWPPRPPGRWRAPWWQEMSCWTAARDWRTSCPPSRRSPESG